MAENVKTPRIYPGSPKESAATQILRAADDLWPGSIAYIDGPWVLRCHQEKAPPAYEDLFGLFTDKGEPGMEKNWMSELCIPHPTLIESLGTPLPFVFLVHPKQVMRFEQWLGIQLLLLEDAPPCDALGPEVHKYTPDYKDRVLAAEFIWTAMDEDFLVNGQGRIRLITAQKFKKDDPDWERRGFYPKNFD